MLRANEPALQVYLNEKWLYVFGEVPNQQNPATTATREKALNGRNLYWFKTNHGSLPFRVEKKPGVIETYSEYEARMIAGRLKERGGYGSTRADRKKIDQKPRLSR